MGRKRRRQSNRGQHQRSMTRAVATGTALAAVPPLALSMVSRVKGALSDDKSPEGDGSMLHGIASAIFGDRHGEPDSGSRTSISHIIDEHIDVAVPRTEVYRQWTQLDSLQSIMDTPTTVAVKDRKQSEWMAKVGPVHRSWCARIEEQVPEERISWRTTSGVKAHGSVTFHELADELTRIQVQIEHDPQGPLENIANLLGVQERHVQRDLRLFKHYIELRGEAT